VIAPRVEVGPSFHTRAQEIGANQSESADASSRLPGDLASGDGG
jgi:hypothetical protein